MPVFCPKRDALQIQTLNKWTAKDLYIYIFVSDFFFFFFVYKKIKRS